MCFFFCGMFWIILPGSLGWRSPAIYTKVYRKSENLQLPFSYIELPKFAATTMNNYPQALTIESYTNAEEL